MRNFFANVIVTNDEGIEYDGTGEGGVEIITDPEQLATAAAFMAASIAAPEITIALTVAFTLYIAYEAGKTIYEAAGGDITLYEASEQLGKQLGEILIAIVAAKGITKIGDFLADKAATTKMLESAKLLRDKAANALLSGKDKLAIMLSDEEKLLSSIKIYADEAGYQKILSIVEKEKYKEFLIKAVKWPLNQ